MFLISVCIVCSGKLSSAPLNLKLGGNPAEGETLTAIIVL